jgi:uncharacterized protein (TIGR03083 family)
VTAMPTVVDGSAMVALLGGEYRALATLCSTLSPSQWETATCLPGWTVHDILSHVVGTEAMLLGEPTPEVDVSRLDAVNNPTAELNARWVESGRSLSDHQLLARYGEVTGERMAQLEALEQVDFDAPSWTPVGRDESYGRLLRIRHYDCYMHEHDIRDALEAPAREDAGDLRSATDEVAASLGYLVGKQAALPDGSRVQIGLTGPWAHTYRVAVLGRASVVDSFDRPPTVGITLSASLFLRLTGGRHDRSGNLDRHVEYTGDRALGEQLVANLAFTI